MGQVKQLETDIQYIMNVLSAQGQQKAFEAFENVLKTLRPETETITHTHNGDVREIEVPKYDAILIPVTECTNGMVDSKGNVHMSEPMSAPDVSLGKTIYRMAELRYLMEGLDDHDQICVEACDEHGDVEDLYPMSLDIIEGIELTDGSIVREVRFCQRPNTEPDTRNKQPLVDRVIDCVEADMVSGDTTVVDELLHKLPWNILKHSLPEGQWKDFEDKS